MQTLLGTDDVLLCNGFAVVNAAAVIDSGYKHHKLAAGQFSLAQPFQRPQVSQQCQRSEIDPGQQIGCKRARNTQETAEAQQGTSQEIGQLQADIRTILGKHQQLLGLLSSSSSNNGSSRFTSDVQASGHGMLAWRADQTGRQDAGTQSATINGHTCTGNSGSKVCQLAVATAARMQPANAEALEAVAAATAAAAAAHAETAKTAHADSRATAAEAVVISPQQQASSHTLPAQESGDRDRNNSNIRVQAINAAHWPALYALKHVLKPKVHFQYTGSCGQIQAMQHKLFNTVILSPSTAEVVATAYDRQVLLPAGASFCMSDMKAMQPFVSTVQQRGGADLLVIDPPWENASAKRSGAYSTLTPNHLLYLPVKQLVKQSPCSLGVLWVTNRRRHHRFIRQQLLPAWGLQHVATWFWLKVTDAGEPVTPLGSLHRHPFEQLWLCRPLLSTQTGQGQQCAPGPDGVLRQKDHHSSPPAVHKAVSGCSQLLRRQDSSTIGQGTADRQQAEQQPVYTRQQLYEQAGASTQQHIEPPDRYVIVCVPGQHSRKPHMRSLLLPYVQHSKPTSHDHPCAEQHQHHLAEQSAHTHVQHQQQPGKQPSGERQVLDCPGAVLSNVTVGAANSLSAEVEPLFVELFARELFPGCMSWGNEVLKFQELAYWQTDQ